MNTDYTDLLWRRRWRSYGRFVRAAILAEQATNPEWTLEKEYAETAEWSAKVAAARERLMADGRRQRGRVEAVVGVEEGCFA